jgi:predicted DNA-binding protein with PD1-like motif
LPNIINFPIRLKPGADLKQSIERVAGMYSLTAAWLVTAIGSLTAYSIRFADKAEPAVGSGKFEILSLSGTIAENGAHLHICISDENGHVLGGHLLPGCIIYTTAEIIIQSDSRFIFKREQDGSTQWHELSISEI